MLLTASIFKPVVYHDVGAKLDTMRMLYVEHSCRHLDNAALDFFVLFRQTVSSRYTMPEKMQATKHLRGRCPDSATAEAGTFGSSQQHKIKNRLASCESSSLPRGSHSTSATAQQQIKGQRDIFWGIPG